MVMNGTLGSHSKKIKDSQVTIDSLSNFREVDYTHFECKTNEQVEQMAEDLVVLKRMTNAEEIIRGMN